MNHEDKLPPAIAGDVCEVFDLRRVDLAAIEQSGALLDTKDLARAFRLHVRTVKRLWKRVNVPPMIGGGQIAQPIATS